MDFSAAIKDISKRSAYASQMAMTEEATKTSVILPFIRALGFDVFSLDEVVPEFTADVGTKKGEKVDFALKINGHISILVEAKPISMNLGSNQHSQLYRYFAVTDARIALLTNGRDFQFFSDTEQKKTKWTRSHSCPSIYSQLTRRQFRSSSSFIKTIFQLISYLKQLEGAKIQRMPPISLGLNLMSQATTL